MEANKTRSGMYGEMPKVQIGKYSICMMSDKEGEENIYIEDENGEGGQFLASDFEEIIGNKFDELF